LLKRLAEDHGMFAWFVEGTAYHLGDEDELDHCWLELGHSRNRVVVDITADQMEGLRDRPVVCATVPELLAEKVSYTSRRRMVAADLRADKALQERLGVLTAALLKGALS
jgi:hypothetical protein